MSNISPPSTPAPQGAPVVATVLGPKPTVLPPPPVVVESASGRDYLPSGVKVNQSHDAGEHFGKHVEANPGVAAKLAAQGIVITPPKPVEPAAVAPVAPAVEPPAAVVEPPVGPVKGSITEKLAARAKVPAPAADIPVAPASEPTTISGFAVGTPEAEIATQFRGHDGYKGVVAALAKANTELAALRASPATADMDKLRAENKAMSDRLVLVDLREHPKFQAEFIQPQQAALNDAQAILVANGVANADVAALLNKPRGELGKAVSELAKTLPDFDRVEFSENIRKAWNLNQQGSAALSKSREIYGAMSTQTEGSQRQAFERTWGRAAGQVSEHIVELEVPDNASADEKTAIESYNESFRGLRAVAEQRAFAPASAEAVSENAIKSAAYDFHIQKAMPRIMKEFDGLLANNRALADQLRGIRARNPNLQVSGASTARSGGAGPDGTLSNEQLSKMSHSEAAAALAPRVGG